MWVLFQGASDGNARIRRNVVQKLKNKEKLSALSSEKDNETIKDLSDQITKLGGKPSIDNSDQKNSIKNLTKQLDTLLVKYNCALSILEKLQVPEGWCSSGFKANE